MKICFLAPGNSVHSYHWINFFAQQGHDIHWISFDPFLMESIPGVTTYDISQVKGGILQKARFAWRIRRLLQHLKPQILHSHSAGIYGFVGALAGYHPFVLTAWGSDILVNGKSIVKRPFVRYILHKADIVTTDAEHMMVAMGILGLDRSRMKLIRFGVDTARFKPSMPDTQLRELLGIGTSDPTVISLRNFYPIYDIKTLINALPLVLERVDSVKFVLAGTGPQEHELKQLVQSLRLDESVKFPGKLSSVDIPKYLTTMDVYVSTALSDAGIAASTAEAMACGVASIITDSGENRTWVSDGLDGYVIAVNDPRQLADRIINLILDEERRQSFGERGRQVIIERNDYFKEMTAMGYIYDQVSSGQRTVL